jgi:hypothetical protein
VRTRLFLLAAAAVALVVFPAVPRALAFAQATAGRQNDLDAFMKQVMTRRDDNWKKMQQYTLEEDETFQLAALSGRKIYGSKREYTWFPNEDSIFVRSPVSADGVTISEADRRAAEKEWVKHEEERRKNREKRREERAAKGEPPPTTPPNLEQIVKGGNAPDFVSSAYFMEFRFDEGSYALVGREKLLNRDVYKIEYYPHQLFRDPPEKRAAREREGGGGRGRGKGAEDPKKQRKSDQEGDRIAEKMDKVSMVTLWIEPVDHQILQYEFTNIDFDFLPGRWLARLDDLRAEMRMREAFPNVWLPDTIGMRFALGTAIGDLTARYDVRYHDYKLAEVKTRLR